MFLYALYKSPLFHDTAPRDRLLRIFVVATVVYIVIHSYLNSTYVSEDGFLSNYRHYLYYLLIVDLIGTLINYFLGSSQPVKDKKMKRGPPRQANYPPYMLPPPTVRRLVPRSSNQPTGPVPTMMKRPVQTPPISPQQVRAPNQPVKKEEPKKVEKTAVKKDIFISQSDDSSIPVYQAHNQAQNNSNNREDYSMPIYQSKQVEANQIDDAVNNDNVNDNVNEEVDLDMDIPMYRS